MGHLANTVHIAAVVSINNTHGLWIASPLVKSSMGTQQLATFQAGVGAKPHLSAPRVHRCLLKQVSLETGP